MDHQRSKSIVQDKSSHFAVQIVNYSRRVHKDLTNVVLTRQLLRSGTSIGANVEEALGGHSRKDFVAKIVIAAKEAQETRYWLRLKLNTHPHNPQELAGLLTDCDGLVKMLNSIILTTRRKLASPPHSELRTQHSEPFAANSELKPSNSELHHGDSHGNRGI
jgi:four helix bundle protein